MSELQEGNSIMAALRFYDGHGVEGTVDFEWYAAADSVLISAASRRRWSGWKTARSPC